MEDLILLPEPRRVASLPGSCSLRVEPRVTVDPTCGLKPQGYRLRISDDGVSITAPDDAGAFYAKMTVRQIARQCGDTLPACEIEDRPDFQARGVLLYISGRKVPKMETLYALVDEFAEWKINHLELGIEHTFAYRNHRDVWEHASPMTHEEIRALDAYCRERFIELVPHQQSFGHLQRWLELPRYRDLAEDPDHPFSLCPTDPRSIALLEELYAELLPCFTSRKFNVCCDEVILGVRSKAECDRVGKGRVYLDFLRKVHDLVKRHGRTMHFWADIILHHPELVGEIPRDAVALVWGYASDAPFNRDCPILAKAGLPFYVCPGTSSWNSLIGMTDNCLANLRLASHCGRKHGAIGYLNTDWGDNGHLQHLPVSYLGFAAGAALGWCYDANRTETFIDALNVHVFRDRAGVMGKVVYDLGNTYLLDGWHVTNGTAEFLLVYAVPNDDVFQMVTTERLQAVREHVREVMSRLDGARMDRPDAELVKAEIANNARMVLFGCERGLAIQSGKLTDAATRGALSADIQSIIDEHRRLWLARNREGGLSETTKILEACRR